MSALRFGSDIPTPWEPHSQAVGATLPKRGSHIPKAWEWEYQNGVIGLVV
ncbi:hypothetical protein [Bacteroides sp.]|nr:hypothetical protein [Bacteroides sp.]MDE5709854.1 hypothetical protein [Bacteroides sp.]MDE5759542.1 hypothetical protein [Bacteroides sp.]MDE6216725.1 hypothetical protein [Bacteroides sp.]